MEEIIGTFRETAFSIIKSFPVTLAIASTTQSILSLNISADNLHSFETYEAFTGYCELTYQLDPLLRCSIEAPLNY